MPNGFEAELARVTQGNPLFLGEIIRKLVADRKVTFVGPDWVIAEIEAGYLPQSLEGIVREKIAALDAEGRHLLEQAAALGEGVPVSVLTGSSQLDENQVLRFLDRAEALGLVSLDFQRNDDVMRFLGKRVLEISYGAIDEPRRRALHEKVGAYQETLYQQRTLPVGVAARVPLQAVRESGKGAGVRTRAARERADALRPRGGGALPDGAAGRGGGAGRAARARSIALVPNMVRAFVMAVRSIQLYPPESKAIPQALQVFHQALEGSAGAERLGAVRAGAAGAARQRTAAGGIGLERARGIPARAARSLRAAEPHVPARRRKRRSFGRCSRRSRPPNPRASLPGSGRGWRSSTGSSTSSRSRCAMPTWCAPGAPQGAGRPGRRSGSMREDLAEIPKILRALQATAQGGQALSRGERAGRRGPSSSFTPACKTSCSGGRR